MRGAKTIDKIKLTRSARGFIDTYSRILEQEDHADFASALRKIDTGPVQRGPLPQCEHPAMKHIASLSPQVKDADMLAATEALDWGQVYAGGGIDPILADGMFAAQAAGTYGVFSAQEVATGLFLLAPNVFYPLHTHTAREVYYCLAGEIEITHRFDEPPIALRANQLSETPSGRLHSLCTGKSPALLAYVWAGDIFAPTWWWEKNDEGQWIRTAWKRKPGESWKIAQTEPVTETDFQAAMV